MRDRALYYLLERHSGHELTVKERTEGNNSVPNMKLACTRCKTILIEIPPPRSLLRARTERPDRDDGMARAPRPSRRKQHVEVADDYFDEA